MFSFKEFPSFEPPLVSPRVFSLPERCTHLLWSSPHSPRPPLLKIQRADPYSEHLLRVSLRGQSLLSPIICIISRVSDWFVDSSC
ncbi:hypothetical protein Q5P01_005311 [Channa striata]|uniref:Uncharacterized protein n=1 Tax=Channa striata TaxID=64152 RepID=A0AA88NIZ0_CHASR|nr:hypothetical protein Q5P01_005311 [Channa striata]